MSRFVTGPVRVSVPATSANLGPGFDCLGLALALRDELEAELAPDGLVVEVEGEGAPDVPRDERHLVVRAMRAAFELAGQQPPGLRLRCRNAVPHARGLGSSAAAVVGGLVLARALVTDPSPDLDDAALLALATRLEGHPDNVAPALYGGFVVSGIDDGTPFAVPAPLSPALGTMVFVPPGPMATEAARGLLPDRVPHVDAATAVSRSALLVVALAGRPEQLLRATHDVLHQPYRRAAMPATLDLVDALRAEGVPAVVSGAGPSVLALWARPGPPPDRVTALAPPGWRTLTLLPDPEGARVEG